MLVRGTLLVPVDDHGDEGGDDDGADDGIEVCVDVGDDAPQEETQERDESDPKNAPNDVEADEGGVIHLSHAGDDGSEGANKGHKAGQDDGFGAVFGIEDLGFFQMVFFEKERFFLTLDPTAKIAAHPKASRVTANSGDDQKWNHDPNVEEVL